GAASQGRAQILHMSHFVDPQGGGDEGIRVGTKIGYPASARRRSGGVILTDNALPNQSASIGRHEVKLRLEIFEIQSEIENVSVTIRSGTDLLHAAPEGFCQDARAGQAQTGESGALQK